MAEVWFCFVFLIKKKPPAIKPDILPSPKTSRIPCPRQRILRLSRRRLLLGQALPFGLAVGCLLHCWRTSNGLLCSAHPFRATLGRCFMPGLVASERPSEP